MTAGAPPPLGGVPLGSVAACLRGGGEGAGGVPPPQTALPQASRLPAGRRAVCPEP